VAAVLAAELTRLDRKIDATTSERRRLPDLYQAGLVDLVEDCSAAPAKTPAACATCMPDVTPSPERIAASTSLLPRLAASPAFLYLKRFRHLRNWPRLTSSPNTSPAGSRSTTC
jgi:hypothetical protein